MQRWRKRWGGRYGSLKLREHVDANELLLKACALLRARRLGGTERAPWGWILLSLMHLSQCVMILFTGRSENASQCERQCNLVQVKFCSSEIRKSVSAAFFCLHLGFKLCARFGDTILVLAAGFVHIALLCNDRAFGGRRIDNQNLS